MIAIVGAGAIGSVFATELVRGGHEVVLCGRRTDIPAKLRVTHKNVTRISAVRTVTEPADVGPADWILVATKAYDTVTVVPWFECLVGPQTRVVVLQNGINQVERVRPLLSAGVPVLPALIYFAAELAGPGNVRWTYGQDVAVPVGTVADHFARLFAGSPIRIVKKSDFAAAAWQKLLVNVALNPITTLTGRRMEVFRRADIERLSNALLEEAVAAARAAGVNLGDENIGEARKVIQGLSPETGTSMLYDRLAGRPTEHEQILGAVVETAEAHGVAVPSSRALLALLRAMHESVVVAQEVAPPAASRNENATVNSFRRRSRNVLRAAVNDL